MTEGPHLGGPVDAVGLLAGLGGDVLDAARAGLHVTHGIERQVGPWPLPMQHREAAAPRLPLEVHYLVIPVGQLQHLDSNTNVSIRCGTHSKASGTLE